MYQSGSMPIAARISPWKLTGPPFPEPAPRSKTRNSGRKCSLINAQLSKWDIVSSYDTASECRNALAEDKRDLQNRATALKGTAKNNLTRTIEVPRERVRRAPNRRDAAPPNPRPPTYNDETNAYRRARRP